MLDAAEAMFAAGRYGSMRIEEVAETADVAVGTVYTHFGSKDGLLLAVAERGIARAAEFLAEAYRDDQDPLERMVATGEAYRELLLEHPSLARFLTMDPPESVEPEIRERIRADIEQLYDAFTAVVQDAVDTGHIRELDARLFARFLIGSWVGVVTLTRPTVGPPLSTDDARAALALSSAVLADGLVVLPDR
ncbi:Fatty acid metabolism regulator protein [Pseudonocardia autotrophica]|uniref:Fatty acid metabolism regulator protein n=2 Tax=Pseudonocardia TaxID=1847 RepID=A0A1Y2MMH0_PSEAH|nr:Fatty acid metabolism regulator protein [Pseudonocardia autotrophica]